MNVLHGGSFRADCYEKHTSTDAATRTLLHLSLIHISSRREPFGLVALEAMACGLPVVGSNEGGLPEFINSSVGTLVSSNDEDAFCGAILEELAHSREAPERRDVYKRQVRRWSAS